MERRGFCALLTAAVAVPLPARGLRLAIRGRYGPGTVRVFNAETNEEIRLISIDHAQEFAGAKIGARIRFKRFLSGPDGRPYLAFDGAEEAASEWLTGTLAERDSPPFEWPGFEVEA